MKPNTILSQAKTTTEDKIIKPLHGLRGVAALTVVIGHFIPGGAAALGVVLFFILSGFLIGKLYIEQSFTGENVWRYLVARFARVYPLFAFVIISTALLNNFTSARIFGLDPNDIWIHLALAGSANTVWTISTEFQFYILFVLFWAAGSRMPSAIFTILPLLVFSTATALLIGTEATRIGIFGYLHIFLLGVLAAILTAKRDHGSQAIAAFLLPISAAAYFSAYLFIPFFYSPRWVYIDLVSVGICVALISSAILGGDCFVNRILSRSIFVWLGEISFGVYLFHRHAEWIVGALAGHAPWWVALVPKIAVALLLAHLANKLIERPCRTWLRKAGDRLAPHILRLSS